MLIATSLGVLPVLALLRVYEIAHKNLFFFAKQRKISSSPMSAQFCYTSNRSIKASKRFERLLRKIERSICVPVGLSKSECRSWNRRKLGGNLLEICMKQFLQQLVWWVMAITRKYDDSWGTVVESEWEENLASWKLEKFKKFLIFFDEFVFRTKTFLKSIRIQTSSFKNLSRKNSHNHN